MTQSSLFWATSGAGDGAAAGYTPEQLWALFRALFGGDGVALDFLDELAPSFAPGTVTVAPGAALVAGIPYSNDAAVAVAIPAPSAESRYDLIVLRANWQAQTVRIARLAGVEGVMMPASPTQQRGGIYEIALATVGAGAQRTISADTVEMETLRIESLEIATGYYLEVPDGAQVVIETISGLIDARSFLQAVRSVGVGHLAAGGVTEKKIVDGAVNNAKLADMDEATVKGRVHGSGAGVPQAVTMAQLIALINATAPDRLIDANTTLSADYLVEWLEIATGYYLDIANGAALVLDNGAGNELDADLLDGNHAGALAMTVHAHLGYAAAAHAHPGYAAAAHAHTGYAAAVHAHLGYAAAAHAHTGYAAAAHVHGENELPEVSNAKLANMDEATIKGRAVGAGTGDPTDLSAAQIIEILATISGVADGFDADLLDGSHASALATAAHTHSGYAAPGHTHGVTTTSLPIYQPDGYADPMWTGTVTLCRVGQVCMVTLSVTGSTDISDVFPVTVGAPGALGGAGGERVVLGVNSKGKFSAALTGGSIVTLAPIGWTYANGDSFQISLLYLAAT